jgi:uncharacterized protein (DUF3084 family)
MSNLRQSTTAERAAVTKAQHDFADAEQKLASVKKWISDFESRVSPLAKQLERLQSFLSSSLPQAQAHLTESIRTLEAYANMAVPSSPVVAPTSAGEAVPTEQVSKSIETETTNENK